MTGQELPPEQVTEWLRSAEGEAWSRDRIRSARYVEHQLATLASRGLTTWHDRDVAYVPGFFSLREQAGHGDGWDWEELAPPGQMQDPAYVGGRDFAAAVMAAQRSGR